MSDIIVFFGIALGALHVDLPVLFYRPTLTTITQLITLHANTQVQTRYIHSYPRTRIRKHTRSLSLSLCECSYSVCQ